MTPPKPDANLATRSPWFPRNILPLPNRVGWYETRTWSADFRMWCHNAMYWWDGHVFRFGPNAVATGWGFFERDQWRGRNCP